MTDNTHHLPVVTRSRRGRDLLTGSSGLQARPRHRYTDAGPGPAGSVMLVEFELNGQKFSALNGGPQFTFNEAVSIVVPCADQAEVDYYWAPVRGRPGGRLRLAEGQVRTQLADRPRQV